MGIFEKWTLCAVSNCTKISFIFIIFAIIPRLCFLLHVIIWAAEVNTQRFFSRGGGALLPSKVWRPVPKSVFARRGVSGLQTQTAALDRLGGAFGVCGGDQLPSADHPPGGVQVLHPGGARADSQGAFHSPPARSRLSLEPGRRRKRDAARGLCLLWVPNNVQNRSAGASDTPQRKKFVAHALLSGRPPPLKMSD